MLYIECQVNAEYQTFYRCILYLFLGYYFIFNIYAYRSHIRTIRDKCL